MFSRLILFTFVLSLIWAGDLMAGGSLLSAEEQQQQATDSHAGAASAPVVIKEPPLDMAEGSNQCEIVSCGAGIKDTCKIDCPAGKTPKCSCDCIRNIGPLCMEYKANCRCE